MVVQNPPRIRGDDGTTSAQLRGDGTDRYSQTYHAFGAKRGGGLFTIWRFTGQCVETGTCLIDQTDMAQVKAVTQCRPSQNQSPLLRLGLVQTQVRYLLIEQVPQAVGLASLSKPQHEVSTSFIWRRSQAWATKPYGWMDS